MSTILSSLAEGGQTWAHRMRMLRQVIKIVFVSSVLVLILTTIFSLLWNHINLLLALYYNIKASIVSSFDTKVSLDPEYWKKVTGVHYGYNTLLLPTSQVMKVTNPLVQKLYLEATNCLKIGLKAFFLTNILSMTYFLFRGFGSKGKRHLSGSKIINPLLLRLRLFVKRKSSPIHIGPIPYVKNSETMHTLITGGTGSGKTNSLHHLLGSIRKSKSQAIIVDTTGFFVDRYYRKDQDFILNPFDDRGVNWTPWADCQTKFDYEEMAESFIPPSHYEGESYWRNAAKSLFSSLLQKLEVTKCNSDLVKWSLFKPLKELCTFVEGTKAASHLDPNSEKTASSIRSVASSYLECLEHLKDTNTPFSIKKWLTQKNDSWLFISCKPSQRASITSLISSWISVAVRGVISLEPSKERKIWFILDELPSLNKVKGIETLLTEGRKYGACAVLSLQSPCQLESIYGRETAHVIIGNTATKIAFSENDPEIAERICKIFGKREVGEYQENISYGSHEMRDGVSLSYQKKQQATVSSSDIQSLIPNQAYIKLAGGVPITKIKFRLSKEGEKK